MCCRCDNRCQRRRGGRDGRYLNFAVPVVVHATLTDGRVRSEQRTCDGTFCRIVERSAPNVARYEEKSLGTVRRPVRIVKTCYRHDVARWGRQITCDSHG